MRRAIAWMSLAQASFFVLQLVGSVVVARLLGPYDMGVFTVATAVVGSIAVIQTVGLDSYLVRERELTPDIVATAATINAAIAAVMGVLILGLGIAGAHWFDERGVRQVLTVLAPVPLIGCLAFVPQAMLEREGDFRLLALIRIGSTLLGLALTIGLALSGFRFMSLAYSQVATAVLTNVAINLVARRHVSFRFSVRHWPDMARFGVQILAIAGLRRVSARLSELVLGRTLGIAALGVWSRAAGNNSQIWDSVHGVVGRVVFIDFAQRARDGQPLDRQYLKVLSLMTGLLWPMFAGVAVLARPLIHLVYGAAWAAAATPLALLCIGSILLVSTTMAWEVFVIRNETALQARFEFIQTAIGIVLFVIGCLISLTAAALAVVASALLAQLIYRPHLERMTGATAQEFADVYLRSGLAAAAAVAPAVALVIATRFTPAVPPLALGAVIVAGMGLWVVALHTLHHPLLTELRTAAARALPRLRLA